MQNALPCTLDHCSIPLLQNVAQVAREQVADLLKDDVSCRVLAVLPGKKKLAALGPHRVVPGLPYEPYTRMAKPDCYCLNLPRGFRELDGLWCRNMRVVMPRAP